MATVEDLSERMESPLLEYVFDTDTQFIENKPLIIMGQKYEGIINVKNPTRYQYLVLSLTPQDRDMKIEAVTDMHPHRHIMPGKTGVYKFTIETKTGRREPFRMETLLHGGYIL